MISNMSAPFGVEARCERASISSGRSTLWASIRVDAKGKALEAERAVVPPRAYLGGSRLGHPCERALQFEFAGAPKDEGAGFNAPGDSRSIPPR